MNQRRIRLFSISIFDLFLNLKRYIIEITSIG